MKRVAIAVLWGLSGVAAAAAPGEPSFQQIEAVRIALIECRLTDPAEVLDQAALGSLAELRAMAMHEPDFWSALATTEMAAVAVLRSASRFEMSDVYAAACTAEQTAGMRSALPRMRAADPVVVRDAAWVPFLTAGGEYLGVGLGFARQNGAWRWSFWENHVLARSADSHALSMQVGMLLDVDDDDFAASCFTDVRPAPEPDSEWEKRLADGGDAYDDASNALGAAQRLAALRLAEGRGEPPSATAKVILAEILLRSLDFANAPPAGSAQWRRRIERSERLLADARPAPIDWLRMAPLLVWLARAHESPISGLPFDPRLANAYLNLAASSNDAGVLEMIASPEPWTTELPSDSFHFEMPSEATACNDPARNSRGAASR